MRYLVTGGAGFIGSNLVNELVRRGHSVVVLDDLSTGKQSNLANLTGKIEVVKGDICDVHILQSACHGADYVLHLAAKACIPHSIENVHNSNAVNVNGTLNVLIAARNARVRRVVFASSSSAYSDSSARLKVETMPALPRSPFGLSKLIGEVYAQIFARLYGLETVSLRYFNVFGPGEDPDISSSGAIARFVIAVLDGAPPVVFGDGEQSRDFTYVENVVDATLRACESPGVPGLVINVGTGTGMTLNGALRVLEKVSGTTIRPKYELPRNGGVRHSVADIERARRLLGYQPSVGFEEGVRRTWEWYRAARCQTPWTPLADPR